MTANAPDPDAIPRRRAAIVHELDDTGQTVVFDEAGERLLVLDDLAAAIWYLIDGRRSVREIGDFVSGNLPPGAAADPARAASDAGEFLARLAREGLVEFGDDAAPAPRE